MKILFRDALIWHMSQDGTKIVDLVRDTGVSRDVINKLMSRDGASTTAENAVLIAAFYGKTVNQFIALETISTSGRLMNLVGLLTPEEQRLLAAQVEGLIRLHGG